MGSTVKALVSDAVLKVKSPNLLWHAEVFAALVHSMGDQQQLSRSSDPCYLVWLSRVFEATVEMLYSWVVATNLTFRDDVTV